MKVAVLICAHCRPEILKLTMGTWLEHYKGDYEVQVYVSLHKNYSDYNNRLDEITSMPNIDFTFVNEVVWNPKNVLRYSQMHARALEAIMNKALNDDCTHLAIIDHDLIFQDDFIGWCLSEYSDYDLICGFMGDNSSGSSAMTDLGKKRFAPKLTVWNMLISRRMAERSLGSGAVAPTESDNVVYDTFAYAYSMMGEWGFKEKILSKDELERHIKHLWSLSFNFGVNVMGVKHGVQDCHKMYRKKVMKYVGDYNDRFSEGIDKLLGKLNKPV